MESSTKMVTSAYEKIQTRRSELVSRIMTEMEKDLIKNVLDAKELEYINALFSKKTVISKTTLVQKFS